MNHLLVNRTKLEHLQQCLMGLSETHTLCDTEHTGHESYTHFAASMLEVLQTKPCCTEALYTKCKHGADALIQLITVQTELISCLANPF